MQLFGLFGSASERYVCFDVLNFESAPTGAVARLETELPPQGAIPGRVDEPSKTICIRITDPSVSDEQAEAMVRGCGFEVRRKKGAQSDRV